MGKAPQLLHLQELMFFSPGTEFSLSLQNCKAHAKTSPQTGVRVLVRVLFAARCWKQTVLAGAEGTKHCPSLPHRPSSPWQDLDTTEDFHLSLPDQRDNLREVQSARKQDLRRTSNNVFFQRIACLQQKGKGSGKTYQRKGRKMADGTSRDCKGAGHGRGNDHRLAGQLKNVIFHQTKFNDY